MTLTFSHTNFQSHLLPGIFTFSHTYFQAYLLSVTLTFSHLFSITLTYVHILSCRLTLYCPCFLFLLLQFQLFLQISRCYIAQVNQQIRKQNQPKLLVFSKHSVNSVLHQTVTQFKCVKTLIIVPVKIPTQPSEPCSINTFTNFKHPLLKLSTVFPEIPAL